MKQILLAFIALIFTILSGIAQDKIITTNNDTIDCKVIGNSTRLVRFRLISNGIETQGKLDRARVKQIIISNEPTTTKVINPIFNRWRIGFSGGAGYLVADTKKGKDAAMSMGLSEDQADVYYKQLTLGWQAGANVHYFLQPDLAVGLNYRFFTSNADLWATMDPQDGVHMYYGKVVDNMYVNYGGISIFASQPLTANHKLYMNSAISAGISMYRDESTLLSTSYLFTGKGFGLTFDLGMEYFILKQLSVGANLNLFGSKIRKITLNDGNSSTTIKMDKENSENISSLDLSAGMKIYF